MVVSAEHDRHDFSQTQVFEGEEDETTTRQLEVRQAAGEEDHLLGI